MALQSQLLRGDSKLESAAVLDTAHITQGARGSHVGKIQQALNLLDDAGIQPDSIFGQATAAAVLTFKRKRNILGPSQTQPDSIVGKLTMAALDREMLAQEKANPPGALGLNFKIDGRTLRTALLGDISFGVDTNFPADRKLKDKNGEVKTMFEVVSQEFGVPDFWGRYLFNGTATQTTAITAKEAKFIKEASGGTCRILLIGNFGKSQFTDVNPSVARSKGRSNALGAIAACNRLKVPKGVWVYADIEQNFECHAEWFQGWFAEMEKAGRGRGGLYCDPNQFPFNKPYRAALRATLDPVSKLLNPDPPVFQKDFPFRARLLWALVPHKFLRQEIDSTNFLPDKFTPDEPLFAPGMTVLWQYAGDCRIAKTNAAFKLDLDLANAQGFNSMWQP